MNWKKIVLISISILLIAFAILVFINRDKIVYVGSVELVEVDCSKKGEILEEVFTSDQRIRKQNVPFKEFAKEDHKNQELVISLLEKCGMPASEEVSEKQLFIIWLVLQHANKKYRKKYFPEIEKAVNNGYLPKEQYALMKDRILMEEGKPQLYGTQITNGKLYKLESPETVNERRKEMGMKPIEEYLKQYNIEFESE
jgi:hypothetical protein